MIAEEMLSEMLSLCQRRNDELVAERRAATDRVALFEAAMSSKMDSQIPPGALAIRIAFIARLVEVGVMMPTDVFHQRLHDHVQRIAELEQANAQFRLANLGLAAQLQDLSK